MQENVFVKMIDDNNCVELPKILLDQIHLYTSRYAPKEHAMILTKGSGKKLDLFPEGRIKLDPQFTAALRLRPEKFVLFTSVENSSDVMIQRAYICRRCAQITGRVYRDCRPDAPDMLVCSTCARQLLLEILDSLED